MKHLKICKKEMNNIFKKLNKIFTLYHFTFFIIFSTHSQLFILVEQDFFLSMALFTAFTYFLKFDNFFIGSFELALIRLCRVYESSTKRVIFGSVFLPLKAFAAFSKYFLICSQHFLYFLSIIQLE